MKRNLKVNAFSVLFLVLLSLAACGLQPEIVATPEVVPPVLGTPLIIINNNQQILDATQAQAQAQNDASKQAAETAMVVRANAQATLDSANATLVAAQTQDQNNANIIAAQLAATAQVARAAALATVNSAEATQSAAQTQDAIRQTQQADQATSDAAALLNQQNRLVLAASTQTEVANQVATQTQSAVGTTQAYVDQVRQTNAQRQVPITFFWVFCLPVFLVFLAILVLWGFWRWLQIHQDHQLELEKTPDELPPLPVVEIIDHRHEAALLHFEKNDLAVPNPPPGPDGQTQGWLNEVKDQLLSDEKKDEDDQPDN